MFFPVSVNHYTVASETRLYFILMLRTWLRAGDGDGQGQRGEEMRRTERDRNTR